MFWKYPGALLSLDNSQYSHKALEITMEPHKGLQRIQYEQSSGSDQKPSIRTMKDPLVTTIVYQGRMSLINK